MANDEAARDAELAGFVPLLAVTLLGAGYEGIRQTDAYLGPGLATPRGAAVVLVFLSFGVGLWYGRRALLRARSRSALLQRQLVWLSGVCSASGPLWFWAFQTPGALAIVGGGLPIVIGLSCGSALGSLLQGAGLAYRELDAFGRTLAPVRLLAALLLGLVAVVGLSYAGLWRAAACFGLVIAALALLLQRFSSYFADRDPPAIRDARLALALGAGSLAVAQAFVPLGVVTHYPGEVVWMQGDDSRAGRGRLIVTSTQNTFQLFEVGQLRLSSVDAYRFAESAVHPALAIVGQRRRVLLLGPAGGFLEREVLRYGDVRELVSVSEQDGSDFRRSAWPQAVHGALTDPRLRFVVDEPLVWLERHPERFDCILIHLPAPASYLEGKHYTRHFYQVLEQHLASEGLLVVHAGSQASLPQTFATIRTTLESAGLSSRAYEAPVPLQGALSFVMATRTGNLRRAPQRLPQDLLFLDAVGLERSLALATTASSSSAPISTLYHQRAVDIWQREQSALGN